MKTVRDYMSAAQQFHYLIDETKFDALIEAHGIDLAMFKFVLIRYIEKDIADNDCSRCVFSRQANVWLMCDKHRKRATRLCDNFQLNESAQEFNAKMHEYIAALRNIHDYDELLTWLNAHACVNKYCCDSDFYGDFYDCLVDESAVQQTLCQLAKLELKRTEESINSNSRYLAKLQQSIVDVQNTLTEQQNHVQQVNDFLNNLIQG